ncbi:MAG: ATP synthase F1 subunit gamma [Nitrospirae bacterium]|uniref:ATP synthase F1 subunit gamma n=1 Tax=Candidatus Magnetobacterium casense TaxID=1455061 RepID=UPI00058F3E7D|nr:ATP synthase F1 subunit gamma [Candidatus Magnetobacterium casensis]MBF0338380.1 ATP synthase F1 subunit gamma [Nitrospirota bacterium]
MPSLRDIRKRITSIKSTGKITRAMQMVSAAKLRRAQSNVLMARPYSNSLNSLIMSLSAGVDDKESYPLLSVRPIQRVEVLVLTSDKGLCGAFNTNILKDTQRLLADLKRQGVEVNLTTIGKKAKEFFHRMGVPVRKSVVDFYKTFTYEQVQGIANEIIISYTGERPEDKPEDRIDEFIIVYNEFKSTLVQTVKRMRLLPIEQLPGEQTKKSEAHGHTDIPTDQIKFLFEPSELEIINGLLPKYVENRIYLAILESQVSEEAARMVAMENATQNVKEMLEQLTLQYNKARQASITNELLDIVGGASAITSS